MNKKYFMWTIMLIGLFVLAGCSFLNPQLPTSESKGAVKITFAIPDLFLSDAEQQYVSHTLNLTEINITVKKGTQIYTKTAQISNNVKVIFDSLTIGIWDIEVIIKDSEGFVVYKGNSTANITANSTTTAPINLILQPGSLDITVNIPADFGITSGEVILINPVTQEQINQTLTISGNIGTASYTQLLATTWKLAVSLYNASGEKMANGEVPVDILPSRIMKATVTPDVVGGSLQITINWQLAPLSPLSCIATTAGSNVVITWEASPSQNIAGYVVFKAVNPDGPMKYITTELISDTLFVDSDIKEGLTYWYWVQAYSNDGLSSDLTAAAPLTINDLSKILFEIEEAYTTDLAIMDIDGSNIVRLTNTPGNETLASWSNDGRHILYQYYEQNTSDIFLKDLVNNTEINLTNSPEAKEFWPSYSSDGTKIIYTRQESNTCDIYIMNADGTGQYNVSNTPTIYENSPTISPDGTKILFIRNDGDWRAYTMNIDGSNVTKIPIELGVSIVLWSPDSSKIIVEGNVINEDGTWADRIETWILNPDGTNPVKLISSIAGQNFPNWSPDGQKLVFGSDDNSDYLWDLIMMNPDGTGLTKLPEDACYVEAPTYSPDGNKIYFGGSIGTDNSIDICVINTDGSGYMNLTPDTLTINYQYPKMSWF